MIRIESVTKSFAIQKGWSEMVRAPFKRDIQAVLSGVNLHVRPGEFYGVLGQNGAGKSTLFRILAGLVVPDTGSVFIDNIDVVKNPNKAHSVLAPVAPSERSLYWRISAYENLKLFCALHNIESDQVHNRITHALEVTGLSSTGRKQVGLFSSGMKQRLLIARALLSKPRVLLLDEPTRSLDPVSAREFRRFLRDDIGREQQVTVLLATHDHEEVRDLCDRIGVLHKGNLVMTGPTSDVLESIEHQRIRIRVLSRHATELHQKLEQLGYAIEDIEDTETEWCWIRLLMTDNSEPSDLANHIFDSGYTVSRIERDALTLADLLEHVASSPKGFEKEMRT